MYVCTHTHKVFYVCVCKKLKIMHVNDKHYVSIIIITTIIIVIYKYMN